MNAFFGYIELNKSESYKEKNNYYVQTVLKKFPGRFENKQIAISEHITIVGNVAKASVHQHQPEEKILFFIGDIYNANEIKNIVGSHQHKLQNHAELSLHLIIQKGVQAIENINGQFIIIYIDKQRQKIYILNDQMGVKQLFYYHHKNILLFGSEIKFLLPHPQCPKALDWETSLHRPLQYKVLNSFRNYNAWFKHIFLLPEASMLEMDIEKNTMTKNMYWNHVTGTHYDYNSDNRTVNQVMEEYIHLLNDSITMRANSNGTTYSLLSGGLDSSAIAALYAKHGLLKTFSIITQITYAETTTDICYNLSKDLHFDNAQFLVPMHRISFNEELWKRWVWRIESPMNHTDSLTKTMLHYAIRKNYPQVTSVLTGTGSDQLNGGLVRWVVNDAETPEKSWENFYNAIQDAENNKLIHPDDGLLWDCRHFVNRDFLAHASHKKVPIEYNTWMFYVNSALYGEEFSLLWDEVRASNYHGHTTHFPFLDFRFIDFIAKIPPKLHQHLFFDKEILRAPLKNILPNYVLNKPKAPSSKDKYDFRIPLYNYLTSKTNLLEEALGNFNEPHPVINKPALFKKIQQLQQKPNILEWINIIEIINLALLEKMIDKDEQDMNIEMLIDVPQEVSFTDKKKAIHFLEKELSIQKIDTHKTISFCENCYLLFDESHKKYYLSKENTLVYEIEDQYPEWKNFLLHIDNEKSIQQIAKELGIHYSSIKEFLGIAIDDEILCISTQKNILKRA